MDSAWQRAGRKAPLPEPYNRHLGRVAQGESAALTQQRPLVRSQPRPRRCFPRSGASSGALTCSILRESPDPSGAKGRKTAAGVSFRLGPRRPAGGMNRSRCGPIPGGCTPARRSRGCRPSPGPAVCAAGRAGPGRPEPRRTCRGSLTRRIPSVWLPALTAGGAQRRTPRYWLRPRTRTVTGQPIDEQLQGQPLPAGIEDPLVPAPTTAEPEIQTPASSGDRTTAVLDLWADCCTVNPSQVVLPEVRMSNERLRAAVLSSGVGIDGVANRLGVDRKTIERWIAGRVPYRRHQYALAAALPLDVAYLWPDAATALERTAPGQAELVALFPARRWRRPSAAWSPGRAPAAAASRR